MDPSPLTGSPPLPDQTVDDRPLPANLEWAGPDGQLRRLGNSSNPVNFIVDLDESSQAVLFLVRIDVGLRAQDPKVSNVKISLFLRIRPDQVRSLTLEDPPEISTGSNTRPGIRATWLRFELTSPMDLVAPEPKLRAKNKAQSTVLHTIMLLAQQTTFSVRLEDQEEQVHRLQWLCRAVSETELQPKDMAADLRNYYRGQGGHIISIDPSCAQYDTVTQSPPSYGELGSPPPFPATRAKHGPSETGSEAARSSKRRRLASPTDGTDTGLLDQLANVVSTQMMRVEERMVERMDRMEERMMDRMDKLEDRIISLDQRLGSMEESRDKKRQELEEEVEAVRAEVQEVDERLYREVESEVEDQIIPAKWELKEYVEEQVGEAVESIRDQLVEGDIQVEGTVRLVGS